MAIQVEILFMLHAEGGNLLKIFSILGLHSDLFLGSSDQLSTNQYDSDDELHQGMLSALTDDIINLIMSLDVVHFKTMLDKSRATNQEQEEDLRRKQATISDLECRVSQFHKYIPKIFLFISMIFPVIRDGS